jgi:hypothetical protein
MLLKQCLSNGRLQESGGSINRVPAYLWPKQGEILIAARKLVKTLMREK